MAMYELPENTLYQVLMNAEAQYSLWLGHKEVPLGWKLVYGPENKDQCLAYVKKYWTDMRPKSLLAR